MNTFALELRSSTQYQRVEALECFMARDASGAFGLQANHERMMTVLTTGLARFRTADRVWHYVALPGGLALFEANVLAISTRRYVFGEDFHTVAEAVERTLLAEDTALGHLKESVTRLEREMVRRLWRLGMREA